jgi:GT2 family glycosyltransferase
MAGSRQSSQQPDRSPKVSVVIVTYRSMNELPGCMESVLKQSVPIEVLLIDNASPDGTTQMVSDIAKRSDNVHAILNSENIGLAAGNNCAVGKCHGDYVLILNPDTVLPEKTLERMVRFLELNPDVGALGPKSLYEDGTPHVSFHRHWGLLHVIAWRILPYRFVRAFYDRFSSFEFQDVLFVSGACLLVRRGIFEQIGGYDPEYFLTVEDAIDLCIRVKESGRRIVFYPDAEVIHFTGRSGSQVHYLVVWQGVRGTVYHFLKHKGKVSALLVSALLGSATLVRVLIAGVLGIASKRYRAVARAYSRVLWDLMVRNPIHTHGASTNGNNRGKECAQDFS